jgi:hypothetical protein
MGIKVHRDNPSPTITLRIVRPAGLILFNFQGLHVGSDSIIVVEHSDGKNLLCFLLPYDVLVEILY